MSRVGDGVGCEQLPEPGVLQEIDKLVGQRSPKPPTILGTGERTSRFPGTDHAGHSTTGAPRPEYASQAAITDHRAAVLTVETWDKSGVDFLDREQRERTAGQVTSFPSG